MELADGSVVAGGPSVRIGGSFERHDGSYYGRTMGGW